MTSLALTGAVVQATYVQGTAPAWLSGTPADGTYVLTKQEYYSPQATTGVVVPNSHSQETIQITGGNFTWTAKFESDATQTVQGTVAVVMLSDLRLDFENTTCGPAGRAVNMKPHYTFSAMGSGTMDGGTTDGGATDASSSAAEAGTTSTGTTLVLEGFGGDEVYNGAQPGDTLSTRVSTFTKM
jgi:hypothetical protein